MLGPTNRMLTRMRRRKLYSNFVIPPVYPSRRVCSQVSVYIYIGRWKLVCHLSFGNRMLLDFSPYSVKKAWRLTRHGQVTLLRYYVRRERKTGKSRLLAAPYNAAPSTDLTNSKDLKG